ncbi:PAS domain-containing sensor histidine kinase [Altererythrobacter sp. TH136]|uniref:PAS domain-containing sensor histidine kinase n=1 Tax=Altererythrobacter sp. TH136 TaxID=2067415 RepID=UPI001164DF48|nr:PAS domain-containing sensor histidine kinase [Altererythrobacter sp. TH136]QDM41805.1 PAS domain-containing protein [Altererythrobacter sp. TH136]
MAQIDDEAPKVMASPAFSRERLEELRKALGPFASAVQSMKMPMVLTDRGPGHPILFANESLLALTGHRFSELAGRPVSILLRNNGRESDVSAISAGLDSKAHGALEAICCRADGEEYLATVFFSPIGDELNDALYHTLAFIEVSGRVDRLIKQRSQLAELYTRAPGFIAATEGPEHRFTFANPAYERLVGRYDFIGQTVADVLPEIRDQGFIAILDTVYRTGEPFVGEAMPIRLSADGRGAYETRYIDFVYQPVRDDRGKVTGLFAEGSDVTAEKTAEQQLALLRSEIAHVSRVNIMGMMAATLAHELNQPLAAISMFASAGLRSLRAGTAPLEHLEDVLGEVEGAARRAGDVIRSIRDLTRRGETSRTCFSLTEALAESARLVRVGDCNSSSIVVAISDDIPVVADRVQIQQVVINLLRNACAAKTAQPNTVTLGAHVAADAIVVSVRDQGQGLSVEAAQNIFIWTDSRKEGGTGLGLAICRTIVESHGGRIWLEQSDLSGSEFRFSLPQNTEGCSNNER